MARFQREAQVLALLDHQNIGPIFGKADSEDSSDCPGAGRRTDAGGSIKSKDHLSLDEAMACPLDQETSLGSRVESMAQA
jgi:hypothetical protein